MLGGLFSAIGKGIGAVGKGVAKANKFTIGKAGEANKYTMGKVGTVAKAGVGKISAAANKASGYEPNLKGPAPKVETDVYGNTSLSTPKVQDPNTFKGRGGVKGGLKRVLTGDPQAGGEKGTPKPTGSVSAPSKKSAATGKLQPPLEYETAEFNPNWRNWKSKPVKVK